MRYAIVNRVVWLISAMIVVLCLLFAYYVSR